MKLTVERLEDRTVPTSFMDGFGNLIVSGDVTSETFTVNTLNPAAVNVTRNGASEGVFNVTGRVIVYLNGGNDLLSTPGNLVVEAHGGDGNDDITGGNADDVIWGDGGNDSLKAVSGCDVLIGGLGQDFLSGQAGNDVLIGGELSPAITYNDLDAADDPWCTSADPAALDALLTGNVFDPNDLLNRDVLTGGSGADYFLGRDDGPTPDIFSGFSLLQGDVKRQAV